MTYEKIISKLLKNPIKLDDFLNMLSSCKDSFFTNPELELELLVSNGLPIDFIEDSIYLKTTNTPISEQVFCIVDIETNGSFVKKGAQIIELGAVKLQNGKIIDKFDSLVYAKDIPQNIQELTNISPDMLKDAPVLEKVLKDFKLFLADDVFVAHAIKFDYNFISDSFEKYDLGKLLNRKLCTIDLAKRTIKAQKYGLSFLKELLDIQDDNHHRAYFDALENLEKDIKTSEDLIAFCKSDNIVNNK